jgi:hypothetical protein
MKDHDLDHVTLKTEPYRYQLLTDPIERRQLFSDAQKLVDTVLTTKPKHRPDVIFFLDRSARPSSWLFRELWRQFAAKIPMPEIEYINIGKEKAPDFQGQFEDIQSQIRFISKLQASRYVRELQEAFPKYMERSNIWVVDEWKQEGTSVMIAKALLEAAFMSKGGTVKTFYMHDHEPPWLWKESWIGVHEVQEQDLFTEPLGDRQGLDKVIRPGKHPITDYEYHPNQSDQLKVEIHQLVSDNIGLLSNNAISLP